METYPINKGIGRSVEFQGLKSQYLFIFAGGLLALFVLFVTSIWRVSINGSVSASEGLPHPFWCGRPSP